MCLLTEPVHRNHRLSLFSITGNDYLVSQGIPYEDTIDLWINHLAMGAMFVGFMVLTYIRLRFLSKYS